MSLKNFAEVQRFFSTVLFDSDPESDSQTALKFIQETSHETRAPLVLQLRKFAGSSPLPLDQIGTEANRWFGSEEEAQSWLTQLIEILDRDLESGRAAVTQDSNGTELLEGDAVTVIKDLKVKGGSSDLKRGTMIKKIHLTGDPGLIECRVDGSTLVLKTEFLRKS
jgi:protein PhnA